MAVLQALFALLTRSAGKILNAIFGWAVHAMFGMTTARDQMLLSGLVGAAVAWPLLVAGIIAPKVAAFVLAFVPIPHAVPSWIVRVVWATLTLAVPLALGLTLASRSRSVGKSEPLVKRILRGFPVTLGLALAFLIMFVSVPILRLVSMLRRQKTADVPLMTDVAAYHEVASQVVAVLNQHGFDLRAAEPAWWVAAPTRILGWFGGAAFSGFVPEKLEHYVGPDVELSFYTSGALLRGRGKRLTWAHGLIVESTVHGRGLQTFAAEAQAIERRIRSLWRHFEADRAAHTGSPVIRERVRALVQELAGLDVEYEEWQVVYRQLLEFDRAVRGQGPLLDGVTGHKGAEIVNNDANADKKIDTKIATVAGHSGQATVSERQGLSDGVVAPATSPGALTTGVLIKEIGQQVSLLAKTELDLAKTELRANLLAEVKMAKGLGVGAILALMTINLWLVTAILALARLVPGWAAGLLVSGAVLVIAVAAAAIGWSKRAKTPLERTRREIKESVRWTKEHVT